MLTILVGDTFSTTRETYNEALVRKLPADLVSWFKELYDPSKIQVIRVYTPTLINYIGWAIEAGDMQPNKAQIRVGTNWVRYNAEGVLSANWPHSTFNWL